MMRHRVTNFLTPLLLTAALCSSSLAGESRTLAFEERTALQARIERLRFEYLVGMEGSFEQRFSRAALENKVEEYLKYSVLLEVFWNRPIRASDLERETARILRETRWPERLDALIAAVDHDPFLFQECVARATLVRRLTQNLFAFDRNIHRSSLVEIESLRRALDSGLLDPGLYHARRTVTTVFRSASAERGDPISSDAFVRTAFLDAAGYRSLWESIEGVGKIGPLRETRTDFSIRVLLSEAADHLVLADYRVPKRSWDEWWREAGAALDASRVQPVASEDVALDQSTPRASSGSACAASVDDVWTNGVLDDFRDRNYHTAVWTGSEVIYWGGERPNDLGDNTGARYDPVLDVWSPVTTEGAPPGRQKHVAVWTGSEMIMWGGCCASGGGRYDPLTDSWVLMSMTNAPNGRVGSTAVWTGSEMIVWGGGFSGALGGRYDPATDSWASVQPAGAARGPERAHRSVDGHGNDRLGREQPAG